MSTRTTIVGLATVGAAALSGSSLAWGGCADSWAWSNPLPTGSYLADAAANARRVLVVGNAGTIVTSDNGATWSLLPAPTDRHLCRVAWSGPQFVAVGSRGEVAENRSFATKASQTNLSLAGARGTASEGAGMLAYASVVDNLTNDPTTVELVRWR